jgi:tetratricopeptide (TPR) repeat protein
MVGEIYEKRGAYDLAMDWYRESMAEREGTSAAWRAARVSFLQKKYSDTIEFYLKGLRAAATPSLLDDGVGLGRAVKILYATSLHELGQHAAAKDVAVELRKENPTSKSVALLCDQIELAAAGDE